MTAAELLEVEKHYRDQLLPNGKRARRRGFKFTDKDVELVRKQLKRFTVEELKQAITETHNTPWNTGDNPNGKKHLRLGLCIDDEHLNNRLEAAEERAEQSQRDKERRAAEAYKRQKEKEREQVARERATGPDFVDTRKLYREALKNN